ncbi:MAG: transposase [Oscillospiraceae bacterium]|nr:transposase [Oscillospiraceae bacterium]
MDDFAPLLGGKPDAENKWIKMSKIVPWDLVEEIYTPTFKDIRPDGRPPISSRIAFGALYIKEAENLSQSDIVRHISENVYMHYFVGLTEYNPKPLFEPEMRTQFAVRFGKEGIERINEEIYRRMRPAPGTKLKAG